MAASTKQGVVVERFRFTALILPVLIIAIAVAVQLAMMSQVPNPMAVNWNLDGTPNEFGSPWIMVATAILLGLAIPHLMALITFRSIRRGIVGPTVRTIGSFAPALSMFIALVTTAPAVVQSGVSVASEARLPSGLLLVAVIVAVFIGVWAWLTYPDFATPLRPVHTVTAAALDTTGTSWTGESKSSTRAMMVIIGLLIVAVLAPLVAVVLMDSLIVVLILAFTALVIIAGVVTATSYVITVDASGLTAKSHYGFPLFRVPLDDIARVEVIDVDPIGNFGGWGLRWRPDSFGIIMQRGAALGLTRANGRLFVVTLPDPETPASMLVALQQRHQGETNGAALSD